MTNNVLHENNEDNKYVYGKLFSGSVFDFILPVVEFLGILVPGTIFIILLLLATIFPLINIIIYYHESNILKLDFLSVVISPGILLYGTFLTFSYVIGHQFFRKDPKIPDEKSFKKVQQTIGETGPVRLGDEEKKNNEEINRNRQYNTVENKHNLEFPYRYLHEYLAERGMEHLAKIIPWEGRKPETYPLRSKHFINLLKVRLEFFFPHQYTRIQRNEAHVRLMSSMWYVYNSLIWISLISFFIFSIIVAIGIIRFDQPIYSQALMVSITPLLILIFSFLSKNSIESFLHYQRIREIIFILETAYFADLNYPELKILESVYKKIDSPIVRVSVA